MASWLKAAEDLLEVVDRRAKIVATELSDEQSTSQPSGSNSQVAQVKKGKPREKGSLKLGTADGSSRAAAQKERKSRQPPRERMKIEKLRPSQPADSSSVDASASEPEITSTDVKEVNNEGTLEKGDSTTANPKTDQDVTDIDNTVEVQQTEKKSEDSTPSLDSFEHLGNSEITVESSSTISDEKSEPSSINQTVEIAPVVNLEEKDSVVSDTKERNATELPNNIGGTIKPHESKKASTSDSSESTETQHGQKP